MEANVKCMIDNLIHFITNGVSVLRRASSGNYEENSPEMEALKKEMFSTPSSRHADVENLKRDRNNIARDVRTAFNNLVLNNG